MAKAYQDADSRGLAQFALTPLEGGDAFGRILGFLKRHVLDAKPE